MNLVRTVGFRCSVFAYVNDGGKIGRTWTDNLFVVPFCLVEIFQHAVKTTKLESDSTEKLCLIDLFDQCWFAIRKFMCKFGLM